MTDQPEHDRANRPISNANSNAQGAAPITRMGSWGALIALTGILSYEVPTLYQEFHGLQREEAIARDGTIIGWVDIHPVKSEANHPEPFFEHDDDGLRLWCGWSPVANRHRWFRVPEGQIDPRRLTLLFDRDTIRPIDRVLLESRGGEHWKILPDAVTVIGLGSNSDRRAYPSPLLAKVEVVHDVIDDRPFLLVYTPFETESRTYRIYDPILEGRKISFGVSGYFHDRRPILFDRDTESLWIARDDRLESIAGERRGKALPLISRPTTVPWGEWSSSNPGGRLVVGAIREPIRRDQGDLARLR